MKKTLLAVGLVRGTNRGQSFKGIDTILVSTIILGLEDVFHEGDSFGKKKICYSRKLMRFKRLNTLQVNFFRFANQNKNDLA